MTVQSPNDLLMCRKAAKVEARIKDFILWQKGLGLSYSLINLRYWAIRKFYSHNSMMCNWDLIHDLMPKNEKKNKDIRAYRLDEIQRMVRLAGDNLRLKAVLLLLATSGLRIGALPALNKGSMTKIAKHNIYMIRAYEGENEQFVTFASREATQAIDEYLQDRIRAREIITESSPLFRNEYDRAKGAGTAKRVSYSSFETMIYRHLITNGLRTKQPTDDPRRPKSYRAPVQMSYGLRKWFKRQLRRAKVDAICLEYLMNHKKGDTKAGITELMMTYDPAEEYELLEEYAKALNSLIIDPAYHAEQQAETLKKDLQQVKTEQQKTIDNLQHKMEKITTYLASIGAAAKHVDPNDLQGLAQILAEDVPKLVSKKKLETAEERVIEAITPIEAPTIKAAA